MIGNSYWSTGITLTYHDGEWGASLTFLDAGFLDDDADAGQVSTEGTLRTRYAVHDGDEVDGLTAAIDALMADAARLGIEWRRMPGVAPSLFTDEAEAPGWEWPAGWRELVGAQAERLGWESPHRPKTADESAGEGVRYRIECHAPRTASLRDLDTVVHRWVSTGWIKPGSPAETDRALAEARLAEAHARNEGTEYRIVEVTA